MPLSGFTLYDHDESRIVREDEIQELGMFLDSHGNLVRLAVRHHKGGQLSLHPHLVGDRYGVMLKVANG